MSPPPLTTRIWPRLGRSWPVRLLDSLGAAGSWSRTICGHLLTVSPWAACGYAVTAAALIALIIGVPVLKLKGITWPWPPWAGTIILSHPAGFSLFWRGRRLRDARLHPAGPGQLGAAG